MTSAQEDHPALHVLDLWRSSPLPPNAPVKDKRARYRAILDTLPVDPTTSTEAMDADGVPALLIQPRAGASGTVVHLHGGGFIMGDAEGYRSFGSLIASRTGRRVLLVDYALAPERPFPHGLEDSVTALRFARRRWPDESLAVSADSAGVALALGALGTEISAGHPPADALVCLSPWVDLTLGSQSLTRYSEDPVVRLESLRTNVAEYLPDHDPWQTPLASPVPTGEFRDFPRTLVMVGAEEALLDDSRLLTATLVRDGVQVELVEVPRMPHVWPIFSALLRPATPGLATIEAFLNGKDVMHHG